MKIKDIASHLYLSISTVSKAINNANDISEETRKRVLDFMIENKIKPRKKIKPLKRICIFLEEIGTDKKYITYEIIDGFRAAAAIYEYDITLKNIRRDDKAFDYEKEVKANSFCGSFIIGINYQSCVYSQLESTTIPTILLDNIVSSSRISSISVDNIDSMGQVIDLLSRNGHKKIAFMCGEKQSHVSQERFGGYVVGLLKHDIKYNDELIYFGNYQEDCCLPFIDDLIQKKPTAVACASDLIAIGLMRELQDRGIKIPETIAVTGFDNILPSEFTTPPLTTIKQNFDSIGKNAFLMLMQLIKTSVTSKTTVYGKLIERKST